MSYQSIENPFGQLKHKQLIDLLFINPVSSLWAGHPFCPCSPALGYFLVTLLTFLLDSKPHENSQLRFLKHANLYTTWLGARQNLNGLASKMRHYKDTKPDGAKVGTTVESNLPGLACKR